jgi:hypothetical protein
VGTVFTVVRMRRARSQFDQFCDDYYRLQAFFANTRSTMCC